MLSPVELEQRAAFRERIVQAALDLGVEVGEDGMTMRAIAAHLGVSATALYQHYDGKSSILRDLRFVGFERLWCQLQPHFVIAAPLERLHAFFCEYYRFSQANPWLYRVMMHADPDSWIGMDPEAAERAQRPMRACEQALLQAQREGLLIADFDPTSVVIKLWSAAHGLCSLVSPGGTLNSNPFLQIGDRERFLTHFVDGMISGFVLCRYGAAASRPSLPS